MRLFLFYLPMHCFPLSSFFLSSLCIIVVFFSCFSYSAGKRNILLFAPGYGGSHVIFHTRMADAIAKAGYNVLSFEPEMHVDPAQFEGPKLAERYGLNGLFNSSSTTTVAATDMDNADAAAVDSGGDYQDTIEQMFVRDTFLDTYRCIQQWRDKKMHMCQEILRRTEVLDRLRAYKFDAIVYEPFSLCPVGIAHVLGIKTQILITSMNMFEYATDVMGLPFAASHVPASLMGDNRDRMGYMDRVWNIVAVEIGRISFTETVDLFNHMFRKQFGPDFPNLEPLAREASLCFVNDEFLDFPRPLQANVVPLGPIGLVDYDTTGNASIGAPFDAELEKGSDGVVLLSLGTHTLTSRMPAEFLSNLLRAMAEHRERLHFLMKVDGEEVENMSKLARSLGATNVFMTAWLPQAKLLAHPRVRFFVSHAGYNSMMEAAFYGVPVLAIPFFVDQYRNAHLAARNGWALRVDRQSLLQSPQGHQALSAAFAELLNNPGYKQKAERTQRLIRNKPLSGQERLKLYLDLLFLHGAGDLPEWKSEARHMPWWRYHNLDIWLPALLVAQLGLFIGTKLLFALCQRLIAAGGSSR